MTSEDANEKRKLDESMTQIVDTLPRLWYSMYARMIEEGFSESQAISLLKSFIETANRQ